MEHRIQYLREANGHLVGCIAIVEHPHQGGFYSLVEYRVSVLNPEDQFDKSVARQLALGRLVEAPFTVRVPAHPTMHEVGAAIMKDIARDSGAPSRARRAAKIWLRQNGR
jgi:hypothetical protein